MGRRVAAVFLGALGIKLLLPDGFLYLGLAEAPVGELFLDRLGARQLSDVVNELLDDFRTDFLSYFLTQFLEIGRHAGRAANAIVVVDYGIDGVVIVLQIVDFCLIECIVLSWIAFNF